MTPEEAIQMLDNAVSTLNVNRESHVALQTAVVVIREKIRERVETEE